jgi:hypothetical protein
MQPPTRTHPNSELGLIRVTSVAILSAALFSCTASRAAARTRCESALYHVQRIIEAATKQYPLKLYPRTLKELQHFAASRGTPLDLTPFSEFTYKRSSKEWNVLYTCRDTGLGGSMGGTRIPPNY